MHIITGLGRSGTSFIAEMLHNCGLYMGRYDARVDAGFELNQIVSINKAIMNGDYWGEAHITEYMRGMSRQLRVVKDPRFIVTLGIWLQAGAKIDALYYCSRDFEKISESAERTNAGTMATFNGWPETAKENIMWELEGGLAELCGAYAVPLILIDYPRSLHDWREVRPLAPIVGGLEPLYRTWTETRRSL